MNNEKNICKSVFRDFDAIYIYIYIHTLKELSMNSHRFQMYHFRCYFLSKTKILFVLQLYTGTLTYRIFMLIEKKNLMVIHENSYFLKSSNNNRKCYKPSIPRSFSFINNFQFQDPPRDST